MKKRLYTMLLIVLAFSFVGCGNDSSDEANSLSQEETTSGETPLEASDYIVDPGIETSGSIENSVSLFEEELAKSGLTLEGKAVKDATSIGAEEGYSFNINNMPIEVYLFNPESGDEKTSENLKTAEESGYITMFGIEINGETPKPDCTFNQNLVLIFPGEDIGLAHPDKDAIVQAFMNI